MAGFTKTNGTTQPVFNLDVGNGSIGGTANIAAQGPTNFAGPKLDFFSVTANASVAAEGGVNGYVANVIQAVQQTATVAIFEVSPDAVTLNFAVYPTGAFANSSVFVAAVQTANAAIGVPTANVANSATFVGTYS